MDTNDEKLLAKEEVFQIVGCAIEVLNTLAHGIAGKPYEKCIGRGVWAAKNSIPATARIRRCLQRPESWSVRP